MGPATGFANANLKTLFVPGSKSTSNGTTPTSTPSSSSKPTDTAGKKSSAGAIAGGVIGGLVGLAVVLGGILFFLRRKKQQAKTSYRAYNENKDPALPQLDGNNVVEPVMLGSNAVFEKPGSSPAVSELPQGQVDVKTHLIKQEEPVEMPAEDVRRDN